MLQIIGWMGCLYLIVKAIEIFSSSAHRGPDEKLRPAAIVAIAVAGVGAVLFFVMLSGQAQAFPPLAGGGGVPDLQQRANEAEAVVECMESAETLAEMLECQPG